MRGLITVNAPPQMSLRSDKSVVVSKAHNLELDRTAFNSSFWQDANPGKAQIPHL